jgi:hypothetical protein
MLSTEECKRILGDVAKDFTDEEIRRIRDDCYELADILMEAMTVPGFVDSVSGSQDKVK